MPSRPRSLVQVTENALSEPLFRKLLAAVRALGNERIRSTYQTTFWFPLDGTAPSGLPEVAALELREHLPRRRNILGAEWWLSRMRTDNVQVDFHQDRDERLALETKQTIHPVLSSVCFLNRVKGGALAVTEQPANDANPSRAPDRFDFDLVAPVPNRFVWFEGTLTHGVLDRDNAIPDANRPISGALRLALIVNWWDHRPHRTPTFPEVRFYRRLRLAPGRSPAGQEPETR